MVKDLKVIDSHTEGEPTRVILPNQLPIQSDSMQGYLDAMRSSFDWVRTGCVIEPRGNGVVVGALMTPPVSPDSVCGVVYFNNKSYLHMCGHGTIGLAETLAYLGQISEGEVQIDTVVGPITFHRTANGQVALRNTVSRLGRADVSVDVPGHGRVTGDVGWGGNWFFIVHHHEPTIDPSNIAALSGYTKSILRALAEQGITGDDGSEIDHVELSQPSPTPGVSARNFVMCPGGEFDRSPCGTGTSAVMAVRASKGELKPGEEWVQESVTGGIFRGSVEQFDSGWIPTIRGRAFITGVSTLVFEPADPYRAGLITS